MGGQRNRVLLQLLQLVMVRHQHQLLPTTVALALPAVLEPHLDLQRRGRQRGHQFGGWEWREADDHAGVPWVGGAGGDHGGAGAGSRRHLPGRHREVGREALSHHH